MSAKPLVLITDNIHPDAAAILQAGGCEVLFEKKLSHEELLDRVSSRPVEALMIRSASTVSADVLAAGKHLKMVGRAGVGTDNIDLAVATQQGVIVVNSPEGNTIAAAEHTLGMLMALARHIPVADASMKQGRWARNQLVGVELFGKTLGVIGFGKIGRQVSKVCLATGMKVLVHDPFLTKAVADELGVQSVSLDDIWASADFITVHAPKTRETVHLLNRNSLARCKPGVRIINCARGGIIDEAALIDAIQSAQVAGAALDVFEEEPLSADSPLLGLGDKVILTPHLGASTQEAQVNVALDVAEQIRDFFQFGTAKNAVNIPSLRKEILDPVRPYMPLAEALGSLVRQLAQGAAVSVEIIAKGDLSEHRIEPLTLAVLKGVFSQVREGVNYVNARSVAEENGIQVQETLTRAAGPYLNLLEVLLTTDVQTYRVGGTLISDQIYRIVDLDGYRMSLEPTENILVTPHRDQPGMIAQVSTALGTAGVNISALQVARKGTEAGGESLMVFNLDNPMPETLVETIQAQPGIYGALQIHL